MMCFHCRRGGGWVSAEDCSLFCVHNVALLHPLWVMPKLHCSREGFVFQVNLLEQPCLCLSYQAYVVLARRRQGRGKEEKEGEGEREGERQRFWRG